MADVRLVVHGHFYQPPRENPWTEEVPREPSAAPFHDWNERITAECYRPNGWARVLDDHGRVVAIVDNYEHLSFNVGPTLLSWLERHAPDVPTPASSAADARGRAGHRPGLQPRHPAAGDERDVRTQVRWGLADFAPPVRPARPRAMWLPETAVNDRRARASWPRRACGSRSWRPARPSRSARSTATGDDGVGRRRATADRRPGTLPLAAPGRRDRGVDLVVLRRAVSPRPRLRLTGLSSQDARRPGRRRRRRRHTGVGRHRRRDLRPPPQVRRPGPGLRLRRRGAGARRRRCPALAELARASTRRPTRSRCARASWSCAHGVGRWKEDCGCRPAASRAGTRRGGRRCAPRSTVAPRRRRSRSSSAAGRRCFDDPWAARDAYVDVLLGRREPRTSSLAEHVAAGDGDAVEALTLLEASATRCSCTRRAAGSSTTSPGSRPCRSCATRPGCCRPARRARRGAAGRRVPRRARPRRASNRPEEGDGRDVWHRHVDPSRVDADRVVAHLALIDLLEPASRVGDLGRVRRRAARDVDERRPGRRRRSPPAGSRSTTGAPAGAPRRLRRRPPGGPRAVRRGATRADAEPGASTTGLVDRARRRPVERRRPGEHRVLRLDRRGLRAAGVRARGALPERRRQIVARRPPTASPTGSRAASSSCARQPRHARALVPPATRCRPSCGRPVESLGRRLEDAVAAPGVDRPSPTTRPAPALVREAPRGRACDRRRRWRPPLLAEASAARPVDAGAGRPDAGHGRPARRPAAPRPRPRARVDLDGPRSWSYDALARARPDEPTAPAGRARPPPGSRRCPLAAPADARRSARQAVRLRSDGARR